MKPLPKGHRACYDPAFKYTPAASTDIAKTFARLRREAKQREAAQDAAIVEEQKRVVSELPRRRAKA